MVWDLPHLNGLVQDCSNSSANALELLQFCTKPLICDWDERMFSKTSPTTADLHCIIPIVVHMLWFV